MTGASSPSSDLFRRMVQGEATVDEYVADVKRRVATALEAQDAMRRHRKGKPISFPRWRFWR